MIIRSFTKDDLQQLYDIWAIYYHSEFSFEEFNKHFFGTFVVVNDENKIITAGGVRTIAEAVIVTDRSFSLRQRREALLKVLQVSEFLAKKAGYRELHATAQNESWEKVLNKYRFLEPKGKFLSRSL